MCALFGYAERPASQAGQSGLRGFPALGPPCDLGQFAQPPCPWIDRKRSPFGTRAARAFVASNNKPPTWFGQEKRALIQCDPAHECPERFLRCYWPAGKIRAN